MPFVLDASIVHAWAFDEAHPIADSVRLRLDTDQAAAPGLWWFEIRNGIVMAERRGRLTEQEADHFLNEIAQAAVTLDRSPDEATIMTLARRHRLTIYDAAYLELAMREGVPLATLDAALAAAARREGVAVLV